MSKPQKITAQTLRAWLTEAPDTVAIVDVRDDDRIGGHIKSSINIPSTLFHSSLAALDAKVANVPRVVFHCQLSQIRGPSCASAYWRHTYNENTAGQPGQQQIYVLEGGFSEWARVYGTDSTVTDAFRPELYR
ncbi:similar to Saccharomyces cerevisiae YGR203W YCH1 Phosphatase with sequence similarity to Cdc25p, Arr2p and Mih1p [Geotrichum candidum]|uniref:Similar to Saccharomyces cerevisiae YGR203W YCH1 Phosphatase with sequence similarity to Cdc25p, Arr2p and Mih1p n=1 Tax=Geotrichum candidum TaxID=1173061 RepID=A0A0J9X3C6_GEOCN|nr:similar to Saccharomyces cerevisiae YGR203W YCH1 Phosphatase with sequence similarity to Cdc25p, Arr2p and Mih1p [Geotrichum candidum]